MTRDVESCEPSRRSFIAFLSRPFGRTARDRVFWRALADAITTTAQGIKDPKIIVRSADDVVGSLTLKESVRSIVDSCDFTIAVVTGRNPNVFWEIGYTEAQGKPVIYLVDEDSKEAEQSPVLVAEALQCRYTETDLSLLLRKQQLAQPLAIRLKPFLIQAVNAVKAARRPPQIIVRANRDDCNLPDLVAKATQRIRLITTNLSYFSNIDRFSVTVRNRKIYAFDPPVRRGVDIQVLTIDPESPIVKYRAEQLKMENDVAKYREELRDAVKSFYRRYRAYPNVSMRLYDDLPLQITLIADDEIMTSVLRRGSRSRRNIHFRLASDTPGTRTTFEEHFHEVGAAASRDISTYKWAQVPAAGVASSDTFQPSRRRKDPKRRTSRGGAQARPKR